MRAGGRLLESLQPQASPTNIVSNGLAALQERTTNPAIEDIQWADEASLDPLRFLCRRIAQALTLLLLVYRDDEWNIVGKEELVGREAVIARCAEATKFLETGSTTSTKLKINRAETCVIAEGAAQFQDQENQTSSVASCDVFQFSDERLVEIRSYVIELNKP